MPVFYRYFLAFRPDPELKMRLAALARRARQSVRAVAEDRLHLTLCVLAESATRDRFIAARVAPALSGKQLSSCLIRLGRVRGGLTAAVYNLGGQLEIQDFYRDLLGLLGERRLFPRYRQAGLRPHVTLGHDRCDFDPFIVPFEWTPDELLLIESEVGNGLHRVIGRWPLLPPPQGSLPFGDPSTPFPLAAAAGR